MKLRLKLFDDCAIGTARDAFGRVLVTQTFELDEEIRDVRKKLVAQFEAATATATQRAA